MCIVNSRENYDKNVTGLTPGLTLNYFPLT